MEENEKNIEITNSVENQEVVEQEVEQVIDQVIEPETPKKSKKFELRVEEEFNWDNYDSVKDGYSLDDRSKLESIYNDTL
jgi:hypothetical protein